MRGRSVGAHGGFVNVTVSDYCIVAKPIQYTDADVDTMSDQMVDSVLRHNEKYAKLCK